MTNLDRAIAVIVGDDGSIEFYKDVPNEARHGWLIDLREAFEEPEDLSYQALVEQFIKDIEMAGAVAVDPVDGEELRQALQSMQVEVDLIGAQNGIYRRFGVEFNGLIFITGMTTEQLLKELNDAINSDEE